MQQYGQKPYCVLLFEILQCIAIFGIILAKRGSVYSAQSASYAVQKIDFLGDLGHDHKKFHWIVLEILAKS